MQWEITPDDSKDYEAVGTVIRQMVDEGNKQLNTDNPKMRIFKSVMSKMMFSYREEKEKGMYILTFVSPADMFGSVPRPLLFLANYNGKLKKIFEQAKIRVKIKEVKQKL